MAKIFVDDQEHEVADGASIMAGCEALGVPFGCTEGRCGTCAVEVVEGGENLAPRTEAENELRLRDNERLACQAHVQSGSVKFTY